MLKPSLRLAMKFLDALLLTQIVQSMRQMPYCEVIIGTIGTNCNRRGLLITPSFRSWFTTEFMKTELDQGLGRGNGRQLAEMLHTRHYCVQKGLCALIALITTIII